jgi:hypothetical protein
MLVAEMIEYTTAILLILLTYLVAVINIRLYIFGILMVLIDVFTLLPEPISTGQVIVGYSLSGGILTALTVNYLWLQTVAVIGMLLCVCTAIMKMAGRFD